MGDKYTLSTEGSLYGVRCVNVFSYEETAPTSDPFAALALCDAFVEDVLPSWLACVSSSYTVHCVTAAEIAPGPAAPQIKTLVTANIGSRNAAALPANRVVCCSMYTATYTKRGRGRHYFAGIPEPDEGDNAISTELFQLYETFAQKLIDPVNESGGGQWKPVLWSKTANLFPELTAFAASPQVRTLRGRTPRLC